jgi:lipopolysaccharide export LptBFGC system permease protein LptF
MDVKWFFATIIILVTFAIVLANFFMGNYIALQSEINYEKQANQSNAQYEVQINRSSGNFNQSILIHDALYNNITDLKKGLDPILAVIPNATKAEYERQVHYNQTTSDFDTIKRILEIKLQDHTTLGQINKSLAVIAENYGSGTEPVPKPIIQCENNDTAIPVIENITGEKTTNSLHRC